MLRFSQLLLLLLCGVTALAQPRTVQNLAAFNAAVTEARPGDTIVLAGGTWRDTELVFTGRGTAAQPIVLTVEEKGKVTLEGQSSLQMSGQYLVAEGLVFTNGFTPTSEVISFRTGRDELCNNCRVTECVIDNFNNPERFESDYWVGIYGRNNRFDHNYLTGKRNRGVTLAVRLNTEESRENNHRIDHNYFGHRPTLGSNGGETLRIGTSHYSLTNSKTIVEANYFDRCNGELEVISNKACQNTYIDNTFFECQGTLTMRHGHETVVEHNYFLGNGVPNTGGIRVINESQRVRNNYARGLTGYRFRGALVVMNGVPNSPLNRYFQVKDSEIAKNVWLDCDHVQLCAGSDEERSATPVNTSIAENVFYHRDRTDLFTVYDDISGIDFSNNWLRPGMDAVQGKGFRHRELTFTRVDDGIELPLETEAGKGIHERLSRRATPLNTGVSWYPIREERQQFGTGRRIPVQAGTNTLFDAVSNSAAGDVIVLQDTGEYLTTKIIELHHPLTVTTRSELAGKPVLTFEKSTLFAIENGGALQLEGLQIDGADCPDYSGNSVIRTSRYSMNRNYQLLIADCDFRDLDVNHSFDVVRVYKSTFADSVVLRNSTFVNISGNVLALDKETEDIGIYNAENVIIDNCAFADIGGAALLLHRGGRDESTFGPMLKIDHSSFVNVGHDKRNASGSAITLHGVQVAHIENSLFDHCQPLKLELTVGEPITRIEHCNFTESGGIVANREEYLKEKVYTIKPEYTSDSPWELAPDSPLQSLGENGSPIGRH